MSQIPARLDALREQMKQAGVAAYLIPSTDAHQSEYVPDCWQRRQFISGFLGSAGDVVVTHDQAGLWTDSRYYLQAESQLEGSGITLFKSGLPGVPTIEAWLGDVLEKGETLGVDPRLTGIKSSEKMAEELKDKGLALQYVDENLIDAIWQDRPSPSSAGIRVLEEVHTGEPVEAKLERLRDRMSKASATSHVVTALDAIAWLFNLRGSDVDYNPVFIANAAVTPSDAILFVDETKLTDRAREHLAGIVQVRPYADIAPFLQNEGESGGTVWFDETSTNRWLWDLASGRGKRVERSPVATFKAIKNATELSGIRKAHLIDGVAMVKFLMWLEASVGTDPVTELSAASQLLAFRKEGEGFVGPSFPTISAYGPHGAIAHYSVDTDSDIPLGKDSLYLVDSGGQYQFGTTDITRTLCFGEPTDEQKEMFTRVLRGHIDLGTLVFPEGTTGQHIDLAARRPLWDARRNYLHGTGHGIGHYLNVHEGPISISGKAQPVELAPGHVLSNEPGYYEPGSYGIRIENLVTVVQDDAPSSGPQPFLKFETLTRCPIQTDLIVPEILGEEARHWLNAFHKDVRASLTPSLDPEAAAWLERKTEPI